MTEDANKSRRQYRYALERAKSGRSTCRVCIALIPKGGIRLRTKSLEVPFYCLRCMTLNQSRGLLRKYGTFEAAAAGLQDTSLQNEAVAYLNSIWQPTVEETLKGPILVLIPEAEEIDGGRKVLKCTMISGESFYPGFPVDEHTTVKEVGARISAYLALPYKSPVKFITTSGRAMRGLMAPYLGAQCTRIESADPYPAPHSCMPGLAIVPDESSDE